MPVCRPKNGNGAPRGETSFDSQFVNTHVPGMSASDWWILSLMLRGQSLSQISVTTKISHPVLQRRTNRDVFKQQLNYSTKLMVDRITEGTYGVPAVAKANAPGAMRKIVKLSRGSDDDRVALQASKDVLSYAGYQPPKKIEISFFSVIDKMDAEEQIHYAETGEFPDRFEPELAQLAVDTSNKTEKEERQ